MDELSIFFSDKILFCFFAIVFDWIVLKKRRLNKYFSFEVEFFNRGNRFLRIAIFLACPACLANTWLSTTYKSVMVLD